MLMHCAGKREIDYEGKKPKKAVLYSGAAEKTTCQNTAAFTDRG